MIECGSTNVPSPAGLTNIEHFYLSKGSSTVGFDTNKRPLAGMQSSMILSNGKTKNVKQLVEQIKCLFTFKLVICVNAFPQSVQTYGRKLV